MCLLVFGLCCFVLFCSVHGCALVFLFERERERERVLGFWGEEWRPRARGRWMARANGFGGGVESVSSWRHQMVCLVLSLLGGGDWWRFFLLRFLFSFYLLININVFEKKYYIYIYCLSNQIYKRANNIWHLE